MSPSQATLSSRVQPPEATTLPLFDLCRCPDCGVYHCPLSPNHGILPDHVLSDLCPRCQEKRKGGAR